ncbi:hypothetical protein BH11MYX1_BH11MYX1_16690 [soil metagenome]
MTLPEACIADIVQRATIELFSHYAVDIGPLAGTGTPTQHLALCGVIGFTGPDMRGSLMLGCSLEPLQLARGGGEMTMRDWLAELTNQLLGRVKNRLIGLGVDFCTSTPVVLGGERIAPVSSQSAGHLFTADGGLVSVWFDTAIRPDLELDTADDPGAVPIEGSTLLF